MEKTMANPKEISRKWPSHVAEKFVPTSFWTQDANANDLLHIHLPGFKPDEVRIEVASNDRIKIEGERIVNESKCLYIDQTFALSENWDVANIIGKFEGEHLYITAPKAVAEETKEYDSGINENGDSAPQKESNSNDENESEYEETHGAIQSHDSSKKGKSTEACRVAEFPRITAKKREQNDDLLEMAINCLKRNKGIALSIVISFSIGVWLSNVWIKYE